MYKCTLLAAETEKAYEVGFVTWIFGDYINGPRLTIDGIVVNGDKSLTPVIKNTGSQASDARATLSCYRQPSSLGSSTQYGVAMNIVIRLEPGEKQNFATFFDSQNPLKVGEYYNCRLYGETEETDNLNLLPIFQYAGPIR